MKKFNNIGEATIAVVQAKLDLAAKYDLELTDKGVLRSPKRKSLPLITSNNTVYIDTSVGVKLKDVTPDDLIKLDNLCDKTILGNYKKKVTKYSLIKKYDLVEFENGDIRMKIPGGLGSFIILTKDNTTRLFGVERSVTTSEDFKQLDKRIKICRQHIDKMTKKLGVINND